MIERLENLYRDHRQGLFTYALSIVRKPEVAEDAVHNAFAKLMRQPDSLRKVFQSENAVAYVFRIVRNSAIDLLRSQDRDRRVSESLFDEFRPLEESRGPQENLLTKERDDVLRRAVDALSEPNREAVVLKLFSGLTFEQAGEVTQTSPKTVATRYRRALEKLESQLRDQT
jgi:RNA polymerase sigma-70 factor (ECF subfamily)